MDRRYYLRAAGGGLFLFAGCLSEDEPEIKDSDGDGVIDSEDYAPQDPEVQEKADLQQTDTLTQTTTTSTESTTSTTRDTTTQTPTTTTTRTTTTPPTTTTTTTPTTTTTTTTKPTTTTIEVQPNQLIVDDSYWKEQSRIQSYGADEVTVHIHPEYPETEATKEESETEYKEKLLVSIHEFPREEILFTTFSDAFERDDSSFTRTVQIETGSLESVSEEDEKEEPVSRYNLFVGFAPADMDESDIDYEKVTTIMESDPFVLRPDRATIERSDYPEALDDDSGEDYNRNNVEGAYNLEVSGRTGGEGWTVSFFAYKSAHAETADKSRGRSRPEYVSYELTDGSANELATILKNNADSLGYTDLDAVEFVIDFVQALPYVPDDVSTGFDDYTKFIMETLPEMGGDCEDTSIMLASIIEADAFYYDMILIQPPGHMAAGIAHANPSGWYWELDGQKYAYIETTGQGWGIGDCPEDYQETTATLHQV